MINSFHSTQSPPYQPLVKSHRRFFETATKDEQLLDGLVAEDPDISYVIAEIYVR